VIMSVPRFWVNDPVSVHRNSLMPRDVAMKIGSCVRPDDDNGGGGSSGSLSRGDQCPVDERTIYVAIASYRDWQCRDTVESIFSRASFPERVRVAVTDQIVEGEDGRCDAPHEPCSKDPSQALCVHKDRLDVFQVDATLSIGPVFARHMGHRMYRGEYYYMQADAHVTFTRGWDVDIIGQMEATGNEMAVLSTYLTDIEGSIDESGNSLRGTRPIMCNTDYEEGQENRYLRHGSQPEADPTIHGMPQLEPYWAAGFSFSRGHFVVNVPYDFYQPMIFQGEEMSIGIRGFTIGYDYYAPERSVCFHHYADGENKRKRNKVPHYWENGATYAGSGIKAMYRLLGIVHMNPEIERDRWDHAEEDKYGLGGVRTPELFYEVFGIDVTRKVAEQHLCRFVESGQMHNQFMKSLRPDGMGIDYSKISFRFKDPRKKG
jgi:[Skp1-protein]-hydroxyproline N-acetylglucosaminyltransferase